MSSRTSSKKILQSFQARDRLWDAFVAQSEKMECSIDYLINEAMRAYAELNGFSEIEVAPVVDELPPVEDMEDVDDLLDDIEEVSGLKEIEDIEEVEDLEEIEEVEAPKAEDSSEIDLDDEIPPIDDDDLLTEEIDSSDGLPLLSSDEGSNPLKGFTLDDDDDDELPDLDDDELDLGDDDVMAPPAPSATAPTIKNSPEIPHAPKAHRPSVPAPPRVVKPAAQRSQTGVSGLNPPPVASGTGSGVQAEPARPVLTMIYEGRKIIIQKDQFILGRGTKSADLPIKDSNVSRKHAAIIFHNGAYYIKDLGSTNGVEFGNRLVDSKRIDEGDLFAICGHKFHFTYS